MAEIIKPIILDETGKEIVDAIKNISITVEGKNGLPQGGLANQILSKKSDTDYDAEWVDNIGQVESVNGKTGQVTLTAEDVGATTEQWVNQQNYLKSIPSEYVTETELNEKGYLTEHQDISNLATKAEVPTKTSQLINDSNFLTEHQDISNLATKEEVSEVENKIPTKVSQLENDKGYLTEHQDLTGYAKKTDIPDVSGFITEIPSEYVTETELESKGYLTEHQSLANYSTTEEMNNAISNHHDSTKQDTLTAGDNITIENNVISATGGGEPDAYIKSAAVDGNKLTLTNKDNTTVEFEPTGGSGGGSSYTFTNGLTETEGTVSWDLNDNIKFKNNVICGNTKKPFVISSEGTGFSFSTNVSTNNSYTPKIDTRGFVTVRMNNTGSYSYNNSDVICDYGGLIFGNVYGNGNSFGISSGSGCLTGGYINGASANYNCGINSSNTNGSCVIGFSDKNVGYLTTTGNASQAFGAGIKVKSNYCMGHGRCNIQDANSVYAHIVGNGTSDTARSNAYTLDWQGNGTFAGTVSSSTGADYAEYFEWKDGNTENEDRVGYIVTLDGDKIVKATSGDDILGICSGTAMVLGDSAEWNWSKRFLTDDFGRIIYEDITIEHEEVLDEEGNVIEEAYVEHIHKPKENPNYDSSKPYERRSDRPEWQIVGMMGKLYVRDNGTCEVNGYATVDNGIAIKSTEKTNMRVMERVTENIVRVLLK